MQSTTANAFAADLILPADVSHVATDGDALVVGANDGKETPTGDGPVGDSTYLICNNQLDKTLFQIYCVSKGQSISPQTMKNIDTVEWFFGDARQMVVSSTNKLTAAGFDQADKKASSSVLPNSH